MMAKAEIGPAVRPRKPDPDTMRAVEAFLARLQGRYVEAFLYGSRARGDHAPDSDADIAVIFEGARRVTRAKAVLELSAAAHDALLQTGIHIQPFPIWEGELRHPEQFGNRTLLDNIKREGIRL